MGLFDIFQTKDEMPKQSGEPVCALCGSRLSKSGTYMLDGKKVCENCHRKQKPDDYCHSCGRKDHLYSWDGHRYCNSCYTRVTTNEQCGLCKQKLTPGEKKNLLIGLGRRFCDSCLTQIKAAKAEYNPIVAFSITPRRKTMDSDQTTPKPFLIEVRGQSINLRMRYLRDELEQSRMVKVTRYMPLTEQEPVIILEENGQINRRYVLGTLPGEDFTGFGFMFCLQAYYQGEPKIMVIQIDGQVIPPQVQNRDSLTADKPKAIPYRLEIYFPHSEEAAAKRYELLRGAPLAMKALRYPGYITPRDMRLVGICQNCGSSMTFTSLNFPMMNCVPVYDERGQDVFAFTMEMDRLSQIDDPAAWSENLDGHVFRLSNSFRCPKCGEPYIRYSADGQQSFQERFGHLGCVLLGHKVYKSGE